MPRRRLGVALLVPEPTAIEVDGLRRALGDGSFGRIPPHLTLVPPVNVREDDLPAAVDLLRAAARRARPLDLRLGPAATFHPDTPVVYLTVGGALEALAALRDDLFRPPLERTVTRPYVPHVTVADEIDPDRIPAAVTALADYVVDVRIEAVHLLEEQRGRVWRPIADAAFTRRRRRG
ncbi:MAG TPA: 2'-5' RNA ligase family protein [Acidimicrobiales bacterium]|nr:2'-5' RNA ligase family protein [Acidimicrobiales bacterium]